MYATDNTWQPDDQETAVGCTSGSEARCESSQVDCIRSHSQIRSDQMQSAATAFTLVARNRISSTPRTSTAAAGHHTVSLQALFRSLTTTHVRSLHPPLPHSVRPLTLHQLD